MNAEDTSKILVEPEVMLGTFARILQTVGFTSGKARQCAEIFTNNSVDGVYSHGVNRFPRFVKNIRDGYVKPEEVPTLMHQFGALEQWHGNLGPGPLNATFATERAMTLADTSGIGMVSLANTNHWMRGGTYGWQAARKGYIFIGFTNTEANMPAWGATDRRLGNNPFVIAVPYKSEAIVLDMAMTQFSYGKMELYQKEGKELPYYGGYNQQGELTKKPGEVLESWRALPIGYWKGAGFSLLLDILAVILSGGKSTREISETKVEYGVSQVFIALKPGGLSNFPSIENALDQIINHYKESVPSDSSQAIRYPGENIVKTRDFNLRNGIPVNKQIWDSILAL
jgi:3-dehydro-L-gulonate 2-dehydrogenase